VLLVKKTSEINEFMQKHFPVCPVCKSNSGFVTEKTVTLLPEFSNGSENYAQCKSCNAKWLLRKNEMRLVEPPKDPKTGLAVGISLLGIGYIYDTWKHLDLESLRSRDEQVERTSKERELTAERQIEQYREKINRLTVLFSDGEVSEDSYISAVKKIEENIDRLRSEKGILTEHEVRRVGKPTALWWLVPIFFGIIGGIVAYVGVKGDDQDMADGLLIFGIVWSIILFALGWSLIFH